MEFVGVGFPNPLGEETSPPQWIPRRQLCRLSLQRSDMSIAARHLQSPHSREAQCGIVAHRGIRRGWVPQPIGRGNLAPTMDAAPQIVPPFAPEERYVYSSAVKPVGVGFPNPSGEVTSPRRWIPHRKLCRLSLQRSDMSIAARHLQSPHSRGAQCGIVAHRGIRRGWLPQPAGRSC